MFEILFESFYSINIDDPAKLLFNAFLQEQSKNNLLSYECLKEKNECNSTIMFSEWVKRYFLEIKKSGMSFFSRLIFEMLVYKTNCTRDTLVEQLKNYMIKNEINNVLKYNFKKKNYLLNSIKFYNYTDMQKRNELISLFKSFSFPETQRITSKRNEFIRYFHALFTHRNSYRRLNDVLLDFSYGFYPARNISWIKNRRQYLNPIAQNKKYFYDLIEDVKRWNPNKFTFKKRLEYLKEFNIYLTSEQANILMQLIDIDNRNWYEKNKYNEIKNFSSLEILEKISQHTQGFLSLKKKILSWNEFQLSEEKSNESSNDLLISDEDLDDSFKSCFLAENNTISEKIPNVDFGIIETNQNINAIEDQEIELCSSTEYANFGVDIIETNQNINANEDQEIELCSSAEYELFNDLNLELINKSEINRENIKSIDEEKDNSYFKLLEFSNSTFFYNSISEILHNKKIIKLKIDEWKKTKTVSLKEIDNSIAFDFKRRKNFLMLIFNEYGYKKFNSSDAYKKIFKDKNKPSLNVWARFFTYWFSENMVSIVSFQYETPSYRFNIGLENGKFLTYNRILENLKKYWFEENETLRSFRHRFSYSYRPDLIELKKYLQELVKDETLNDLNLNFNNQNEKIGLKDEI